jgi:hypothetical protein
MILEPLSRCASPEPDSFLPALSLGPIAEQMMMHAGRLY